MVVDAHEEIRWRGCMSSAALVGREKELTILRDAVSNPPTLATVVGEAGIGKTRLVRELLKEPGTGRVLVGRCHQIRDPFPLGPVIEALRGAAAYMPTCSLSTLVGALRPLLPELSTGLPDEPAPLADPRAQRHRTFRALRELLDALGPTLCILEDLHWADGETLEFLAFLLAEPPSQLALVVTSRSDDRDSARRVPVPVSNVVTDLCRRTIELGPFSADEVASLTAELVESEIVAPQFAIYLHERTGGIPFAVEEVVRLLDERGELCLLAEGRARDLEELAVPPALRQCVLERIARLSADARAVTYAAGVVGSPAHEELLSTVAGLSAARASRGLTEALSAGLLAEEGRALYGFRHALAMEAAYDDIPTPLCQRLHLRVARALESHPEPTPLAQIAHHFRQAGRARQWVRYAEAAAQAAHLAADDRSAMELLEQALQTPDLSRAARVRMAIALGTAALYDPSPQTALASLERALDEDTLSTVPTGVRGELRFSLCRLRSHVGDTRRWRQEMLRVVEELRRRPELGARAMVNLALPRFMEDDLGEHLGWLGRAERAARRQDDPVTNIAVASQRASILLGAGDPAGWAASEAIRTAGSSVDEQLQLLRGYHSLSLAALGLGHYRPAESFLAEAERTNARLNHTEWPLWLTTAKVGLDWAMGRWGGLEERVGELTERTAGMPGLSHFALITRGSLLLSRGEIEEAERSLTSALDAARSAQELSVLVDAGGWLARLRLSRGDPEGARRWATAGLDVIERKGIWVWATRVAPVGVQALLACGQSREADSVVRKFEAGLRDRDAPAATAALAVCRGLVAEANGEHRAAASLFARAESGWRGLPNPYEAAQAQERRARNLTEDPERAASLLVGALETFEDLGATCDAARIRAQFRARGFPLPYPWRGGRRGYGQELSPREAEVARLVVMGRTNRDIAETLFISARTVEGHVASVLRKRGAGSRRALVGRA